MAADQTRWRYFDPFLVRLFPISYAVHYLEELLATAPVRLWWLRLDDARDRPSFNIASAVALGLMIAGVMLAPRGPRYHWIAPALAVALLLNTAGHFIGSVSARAYSAGMLSALILWLPLSLLMMMRVADQASAKTIVGGVIAGSVIEGIVVVVMAIIK
jgi:hypothetical protein